MTREKIERLIAVMSSNKIKHNKQFYSVLEHGFPDEARESFFEEVIGDIEDLLIKGVNTEFSKSIKETVRKLTELAVKSGEDGRYSISLEKLHHEKRNCMAMLKLNKEARMEFNLKDNVIQYLESAKIGMEILDNSSIVQTETEHSNMERCRVILKEIGEAVKNAIDVSSTEAAELYNKVVSNIRTWRINLARSGGLYDANSVAVLNDTLDTARSWESLCFSTGKQAKVKDIYEIPVDDLTRIIESEVTKQNVEMFLSRCEAYVRETENMRNNGVMEKIAEARSKLRYIGEREQEIVTKFRNGEIIRDDAEFELQRLRDQKEYIDYEIERLKGDSVSREDITMRREMIAKVERTIQVSYNHVKYNRLHIHELFAGMDFARLIAMINNNVSTREFEIGIEEIQRTLVTRGVIDHQGRVLVDNIKKKIATAERVNSEKLSGIKQPKAENEGSLLDQLLDKDKKQDLGLPKEQLRKSEFNVQLDDIL